MRALTSHPFALLNSEKVELIEEFSVLILQSIINEDPEYVIKRCESGKFAVNDDVITLYFKVNTILLYSLLYPGCLFNLL